MVRDPHSGWSLEQPGLVEGAHERGLEQVEL